MDKILKDLRTRAFKLWLRTAEQYVRLRKNPTFRLFLRFLLMFLNLVGQVLVTRLIEWAMGIFG